MRNQSQRPLQAPTDVKQQPAGFPGHALRSQAAEGDQLHDQMVQAVLNTIVTRAGSFFFIGPVLLDCVDNPPDFGRPVIPDSHRNLAESLQGRCQAADPMRITQQRTQFGTRFLQKLFGFFIDQTAARDALIQLRRFVVDYPDDQRVPDANELMERCMSMLAAHELYVARFYLKRDAYRGVISRLRGLLAAYPGSGVEPQALLLLGEVYMKTEEVEAAKGTFTELVQRFPESEEAKKARSLLKKLG